MPRYRITVEYDGGAFVGWQRQANGLSVQQVIEEALHRFSGETAVVLGAGRTDSGVHALGQVAHFDLEASHGTATVRDALNFHAKPHPLSVLAADVVGTDFHARLSARQRAYLYRIVNRRAPPAILRGRVWWVPKPLDAGAMGEATEALVGRHDFTTFRAASCQSASPVKTLDRLEVRRCGEEITVEARARSFMQNQVRIMVGTLKLVGEGKRRPADVADALAARDRRAGGQTAPAKGLYLLEVLY